MSVQLEQYKQRLRDALGIINELKAKLDTVEGSLNEPIAVIGMGCRFPGGGEGIDAFWQVLDAGVDGIREIPSSRWPPNAIPNGRQEARWAGLLEDITRFDASFFGISPREAETLDPQQRILLEVTWEALEHAGQRADLLIGSRTGVFIGISTADYQIIVGDSREGTYDAYCGTGNLFSTAAGRISFVLGFQGPAMSIDTACSSSLVAIAEACQSLRAGDCNIAIAGGVNAILAPRTMAFLVEMQALSPDGRCKALDARANGFVRGEGCGLLVLKRLSDAIRDGDRIHGLIRGWAVNQDGRSTGLTTPNVLSQQALLRQALERAQLAATEIGYVEMHGTGTALGDPIEAEALREVLGVPRPDGSSCILGAVKTNIGHLEGAAGVAGAIKVLLSFEHERIPKNLHFRRLNPRITFDNTPFVIPVESVPWARGAKRRRAGVSSFGISGTNAHIIVEEPPLEPAKTPPITPDSYLLPLSAKSPEALSAMAATYAEWLSRPNNASLPDIVYTASVRRTHHEYRLAAVASTRDEFVELLKSVSREETPAGIARGHISTHSSSRSVFLFSGQGSQWAGMGKSLLEKEPVFRAKLEEIAALMRAHASFSLLDELCAPEECSRLGETEIAQPALFALQVGLAELLKSWGIVPSAVMGHSVGEIAAAHVCGTLALDEAIRLVILRSRIMQKATGNGKMVWVALPNEEATRLIAGLEESISIAAVNDSASVVLSGETKVVDAVLDDLKNRGITTRPLRVNYAFHSPQMDSLAQELVASLGRMDLKKNVSSITFYSTVTGELLETDALAASYWGRNVRATVQLADAVGDALRDGYRTFIEIGPHPVLLANLQQCATGKNTTICAVGTLRRQHDGRRAMLETLGALHVEGIAFDWKRLHSEGGRVISLPKYPWQRDRYWIESIDSSEMAPLAASAPDSVAQLLYEVSWERKERSTSNNTSRPIADGVWLVLSDNKGIGAALAKELEIRGQSCVYVRAGEAYQRLAPNQFVIDSGNSNDYRQLLDDAFDGAGRCRGILNLFALDTTPEANSTFDSVSTDFTRIASASIHLTKAVLRKNWRTKPRMYWATSNAQQIASAAASVSPVQAALWGVARSLILEYPEVDITRIDLDAVVSDNVPRLLEELESNDVEDQIAIRGADRFVARLVRYQSAVPNAVEFHISENASYLITDGVSRRGLAITRWIITEGARHVVISTPRDPTAGEMEELQALQNAGTHIVIHSSNLSEPNAAATLVNEIERELPPLRGVFANINRDQSESVENDLSSTVQAALSRAAIVWSLHRATELKSLDFFICSSSAASILGLVGHSGYAAGNAFIDAVVEHRRANGLSGTSIQWGVFSDEDKNASDSNGDGLTLERGMVALRRIVHSPRANVAVMRFSPRQMVETFVHLNQNTFLSKLLSDDVARGQKKNTERKGEFRRLVEATAATERQPMLEEHVRSQLAHVLRMQPAGIDPKTPFQSLGVDSLMSLEVRNRLETSLDLKLPSTLLFTYTNVELLATNLLDKLVLSDGFAPETQSDIASLPLIPDEPIAVIGMACRFPAGGNDPEAFWRMLMDGVDAVREVSPLRWPLGTIDDEHGSAGYAAFIDDVDKFDAAFFGISPREAEALDPQQRMLLEITWDALEHAGQPPEQLIGSRTGVFIGCATLDYQRIVLAMPNRLDAYGVTGTMLATTAGRISYTFGFQGPAIALDTACSSSLVAMHAACQSLRNRECELAIAGGVNALLSWEPMIALANMRALSPDGRCKALDSRANGYVRGEGCGVVVLKRLSDARRAGDRILAIIRGSAVNQDGRSTGLTAPNVLAQQDVLRQALQAARVSPSEIGYIEMHGTGTPLGDPIEADALREVLGAPRADGLPCILGAVKTNIGHLEGAAGVAGFIKIVQAFRHSMIPQNLHFRALNPRISFEGTPFVVPTTVMPWARGSTPRYAGISSFGISGTNAHIIVEEAPAEAVNAQVQESSAYLLPLSAKTPQALVDVAQSYQKWFSLPQSDALRNIVYTATFHRTHHEYRLAIVGNTSEEFAKILDSFARGVMPAGAVQGRASLQEVPRIVFVFPGQGSQWLGMGKQLLAEEPVFRGVLEACDVAIQRESGFSILEQIGADENNSRHHEIDVLQPLLFALEVAFSALWRSWGIEPSCVVGHSMGEVAAAYVAGMLDLENAAKVICRRSRLLRRIRGQGAMALVELPMAEAEAALAEYETQLSVAVSNGPRSTVLSGEPGALEKVLENLEKRGIFCRRVKVDVASHSPQVDALLPDLLEALSDLRPMSGTLRMQSTVREQVLQGSELNATYWVDNLRQPVRFSQATQDLIRRGHHIFIEMSPHPILLPAIEENIKWLDIEGVAIASTRRGTNERHTILESLGALHTRGCAIDWRTFFPGQARIASLPPYPWQRERFWVEPPKQNKRVAHTEGGHPLLGNGFVPASHPKLHVWEQWISVEAFPYLTDHRVQGEVIFPGTGYVEMALAAANLVYGNSGVRLEHLAIEQLMAFAQDEVRLVQVSLQEEVGGRGTVNISSKRQNASEWIRHASGLILVAPVSSTPAPATSRKDLELVCPTVVDGRKHYARTDAAGLGYGPAFQGVAEIHIGTNEILAEVRVPDEVRQGIDDYHVHPALLDACFQSTLWVVPSRGENETFVPVYVGALRLVERPSSDFWIHAQLTNNVDAETLTIGIRAYDNHGGLLFEVGELRAKALDSTISTSKDPFANCLFRVIWRKTDPLAPPGSSTRKPRQWLVLADSSGFGSTLAQRLRAHGDRVVEAAVGDQYARVGENNYQLPPTNATQWDTLLTNAFGRDGCDRVINCWPLDGATFRDTTANTLGTDIRRNVLGTVRLVQAIGKQGWRDAPRLYMLTRGAQSAEASTRPLSVSHSMLWGLGRVIALEQPDIGGFRIDLPPQPEPDETTLVEHELMAGSDEDQIAYRSGQRYVARFVRGRWEADDDANERVQPAAGQPYRLRTTQPGVLERLTLQPIDRKPPGPGEVEIEVETAGLNFIDVMKAMGIYPGMDPSSIQLGGECSGKIVAIGDGVKKVSVGQAVIASAPSTFATHVTTRAEFVTAKPEHLTFDAAATIPAVFMTVYWALHHIGRLQPGERILIHSATGGTGLAAIQYARAVGAEVFATAGNEEKRSFLRSMGIFHVMDSRSLAFADQIMVKTNGQGVDVVLNSLTGEALIRSLEILAPYGRFLEIGKKDIYENTRLAMLPFRKAISYTSIDLAAMGELRPQLYGTLLQDVVSKFADGTFTPEPVTVFATNDAQDAFRLMAQAKHIGKIAVRMRDSDAQIHVRKIDNTRIRATGTYLITGGLGGLGLSLARWMVQKGARFLVLIGRSAPNAGAESAIAEMRAAGAIVHSMQANVMRRNDIDAVISMIAENMPPLRGIVHAAGVLADRMLTDMSEMEFFQAIEPKVFGAWNLHEATRYIPLDFFVMYSSAAGLLGSPGQANYAAANAFLDALAHARVADGLPATSIQWGGFADVGLAAASDIRGSRIASRGGASFKPAEGNELFERVMGMPHAEVGVMHLDIRQWVEFYPQMAGAPFVAELFQETGQPTASPGGSGIRDELERMPPAQRLGRIEAHVLEQLGKVLRLEPGKIDKRSSFTSLGIDSLMSLELRNRLESAFGLKLSATILFTFSTTHTLTNHLVERLFPDHNPNNEPAATATQLSTPDVVSSVPTNDFAPEEDEAALVDKLGEFEEFLK